jgi:hypothetical protein
MPLSDTVCRTSKPREAPYKLSDGGGLYLLVEKNGSKLWRHAYRFDGKQKLMALGAYPAVTLADARAGRDANKAHLAKGVDPSAQRKIDRGAARIARSNTFRIVADELLAKFKAEGDDPKTLEKKKWLLGFINADLGDRPVAEIKAPELLDALRKIERRGRYDTARRARSLSGRARDRKLALQIRQFVEDMPTIETRRHVLKKELSELSNSRRRDTVQGADPSGERGDERTR